MEEFGRVAGDRVEHTKTSIIHEVLFRIRYLPCLCPDISPGGFVRELSDLYSPWKLFGTLQLGDEF